MFRICTKYVAVTKERLEVEHENRDISLRYSGSLSSARQLQEKAGIKKRNEKPPLFLGM